MCGRRAGNQKLAGRGGSAGLIPFTEHKYFILCFLIKQTRITGKSITNPAIRCFTKKPDSLGIYKLMSINQLLT